MKIAVAQRFRPFSHTPGSIALIPGEETLIQNFPSISVNMDLSGKIISHGDGKETWIQNLEKPFRMERLSFGNHKQQDVDLIRRRKDLSEILPIWFKLASFYPQNYEVAPGSLLYELVHEEDRNLLPELFLKTYLSGFTSFFVPRAMDIDFNGFELPPLLDDEPVMALITEGAKAIKRMIVEKKEDTIFVLPRLPSLFSSGRLIETPIGDGGKISIEWTKHFLRQVIYTPGAGEELDVRFPKEVAKYRVRSSGESFLFDNFMA